MRLSVLAAMKRSLMPAILLASVTWASATSYYVDSTNGNNSNPGTSGTAAWKTISKANQAAIHPGDQLLFIRGGVWTGMLNVSGSGSQTSPAYYGAYGDTNLPNPTINAGGTNVAAIFISNSSSYVTVEGFSLTNFDGADVFDLAEGNRNGIQIGQWASPASLLTGVSILNNEIYNIEGFSNSPLVAGASPRGTTLSGSTYNQYSCAAIYARANQMNNMTIKDNYIHDCTGTGLYILPNTFATGTQNLLIDGNEVNNVGSDGIEIANSVSPVIQYNTCIGAANNSGTNARGTGVLGSNGLACCGIWAVNSSNVLFQYNYCQGTHLIKYDGQAWDFDVGLSGTCIYQYNYSRDNEGGFLLTCNSPATQICRFNISVNDGSRQGNASNGQGFFNQNVGAVYNNVFYRTDSKACLLPGSLSGTFSNNIFYTAATSGTYQTSTARFFNNCYYGHTATAPGTSPVLGNPLFVNEADAAAGTALVDETGFQLLPGSPCIATGTSIAGNGGFDYWGNILPANLSIGAAANVLVDDRFNDGGITNGSDPLDVAWTAVHTAVLTSSTFNTTGNTTPCLHVDGTGSWMVVKGSPFTTNTLRTGNSITLSFDFRATSIGNGAAGLRFALGGSTTTNAFTFGTGTVASAGFIIYPGADLASGTSGVALTTTGTAIAINDSNPHTFDLTLTRTGTSSMTYSAVIDGTHTFTATDPAAANFAFDRIIFGEGSVLTDFNVDNVQIW